MVRECKIKKLTQHDVVWARDIDSNKTAEHHPAQFISYVSGRLRMKIKWISNDQIITVPRDNILLSLPKRSRPRVITATTSVAASAHTKKRSSNSQSQQRKKQKQKSNNKNNKDMEYKYVRTIKRIRMRSNRPYLPYAPILEDSFVKFAAQFEALVQWGNKDSIPHPVQTWEPLENVGNNGVSAMDMLFVQYCQLPIEYISFYKYLYFPQSLYINITQKLDEYLRGNRRVSENLDSVTKPGIAMIEYDIGYGDTKELIDLNAEKFCDVNDDTEGESTHNKDISLLKVGNVINLYWPAAKEWVECEIISLCNK